MPSIVSGGRSTLDILQARRVVDMHDELMLLEPSAAPFSLLANFLSRKSVSNPKFDVIEDELVPTLVSSDGAMADGVTTSFDVHAGEGDYIPLYSVLVVQETGEALLVTGVSTDTVTVTRSWGGTAGAAWSDDASISILQSAQTEGSSKPTAISTVETNGYNYTQISRWAFDLTGTEMASNLYGGKDLGYQRKKAGIEWAKRNDLTFFFSERNEDTSAKRRSTGGLNEFITTNRQDMGGSFSKTTFWNFAESFFRYGSKDKVAFIPRGMATEIAITADTNVERQESSKSLGLEITRLVTPHGRLRLITHDLLEGDTYGGYGFIVDPANIGYRFLDGRDMVLKTNIQDNDYDGEIDEYTGEIGLFRSLEKTHAVVTNAD